MKKSNINVTKLNYAKSIGFQSSSLKLELTGNDANVIVANTLRRIAYDDIPMYAFAYINIEHNNSVFNNDMMKAHLKQLPIYDVNNDLYYLHPSFWQGVDYNNKTRPKHEKEKLIDGVINVYNNTNEIKNVTTKDMDYYIDGHQKEYPNRNPDYPILLIQLRPNETFKCVMKGCLGIGENSNIWAAAHTYYDEIEQNKIHLTVESMGQMPEHDILIKACKSIKFKLQGIKSEINNRVKSHVILKNQIIFFELQDEDFTVGNIINDVLQNHKDIMFAGVSKFDHLIKCIRFKLSAIEGKTPIEPFFESIDFLVELFDSIEKQIIVIKEKDGMKHIEIDEENDQLEMNTSNTKSTNKKSNNKVKKIKDNKI